MIRRPPRSTRTDTLFPYTTLFRSSVCVFVENGTSPLPHPTSHRIPCWEVGWGSGLVPLPEMCPQGAFTKKLSHPAPDARRPAGDRQVRPGRDQPQDDATRPILRDEAAEHPPAAKHSGEQSDERRVGKELCRTRRT